jgi:hypothetical protein
MVEKQEPELHNKNKREAASISTGYGMGFEFQ